MYTLSFWFLYLFLHHFTINFYLEHHKFYFSKHFNPGEIGIRVTNHYNFCWSVIQKRKETEIIKTRYIEKKHPYGTFFLNISWLYVWFFSPQYIYNIYIYIYINTCIYNYTYIYIYIYNYIYILAVWVLKLSWLKGHTCYWACT